MFHRILACVDGSASALGAAGTAASLARSFRSEVLALNVFHTGSADPANIDVWAPKMDQDAMVLRGRKHRNVIEPTVMSIFELQDVPCRYIQEAGHESEVDAILRVAEREKADLIVIGSRGLRGIKELLLGSVSSGVLHHAVCPVLIVRGTNAPFGSFKFDNIVLASDGSPSAQKAAEIAVELARTLETSLTVLNVYEDLSFASIPGDEDSILSSADKERYATEWLDYVAQPVNEFTKKAGVTCSYIQMRGYPDEAIVAFANRHYVDLIILGSRGMGGYSRTVIGSVSNRVVHHANCPVLVVR